MDFPLSFIFSVVTIFCLLVFGHLAWIKARVNSSNDRKGKKVPEAAGSWPIIGHLHLLAGSQVHHRLLGSMADKFGPIFTIKLGVHSVLIVSNSAMAKECLTTNDRVFASRPTAMASELMGYNYAIIGLAPYGPYWREIRKIIVLELLSHERLKMIAHIRVSELKSSILDMYRTCKRNEGSAEMTKVDMKEWFGNLFLDIVMRVIFGVRFSHGEQNEDQFKKAIRQVFVLTGAFVPSDAIPGLRWLDLGGYEKMMKKTAIEIDVMIDGWLEEHKRMLSNLKQQVDESTDQGFMAMLFSRFKEPKEDLYGFSTDVVVKSTCMALLLAATDTTSATLTWALALLVNNPLVLKKSQEEIEKYVGKDRIVEESDLKNLVYLQAIIKETMRLYPAAPLSLPHVSTDDCIVGGYTIPKGTRLLVNIWKIQHDPEVWTDPFEFQPERFLTSKKEIDVKGQHFELIPFSSGRRICLKIDQVLLEIDAVIDGWIEEHKRMLSFKQQVDENTDQGFMAMLLSRLKEPKEDLYGFSTDVVVKSTCMALLIAATDTTSAILTWALALLVNNPLVLKKSQKELEKYVGKDRIVEESDLKNLVYLQAIVKETMRLYPAAPLSLPHVSTDDCIVGGYTIPKGTRLLVNLWKIQHDPEVWIDPFEFQPERFLTSKKEIDVKGQHFELIPFSSGRRICPGIGFALEAMQLILANIIHGFEFENPSNHQLIDLTESPGLLNVKDSSLELFVSPRLSPHVYGVSI